MNIITEESISNVASLKTPLDQLENLNVDLKTSQDRNPNSQREVAAYSRPVSMLEEND